jgi:hypothetical protein
VIAKGYGCLIAASKKIAYRQDLLASFLVALSMAFLQCKIKRMWFNCLAKPLESLGR